MIVSTRNGYTLYSWHNRLGIERNSDGFQIVDARNSMLFNDEVEAVFETVSTELHGNDSAMLARIGEGA